MHRFDVTIAGEINLDLILYGLPREMTVEREVLASDFRLTLGSSSAILAHNLAVLGSSVGFITMIGSDPLGAIALDRLRETSVDLKQVICAKTAATGVTVLLPHDEGRHILTYPGAMTHMKVADLDFGYLASGRHFHLSSLFLQKGLLPGVHDLFRDLKQAGLTISLDTNDDPDDRWGCIVDDLLEFVDLLLPNEVEANRIAGRDNIRDSLQVLSKRVPLIAVKCGASGALVQQGDSMLRIDPVSVAAGDLIDTIGAGDSFNAGFLHAFLRGSEPAACAVAGNIAGALSTMCMGGTEAFRDRAIWKPFLERHRFPQ